MVPKNRKINNETVWYQQRRYTWTSPVHVPTYFFVCFQPASATTNFIFFNGFFFLWLFFPLFVFF